MRDISYRIPKAELHLHLEGSFEPELMFEIAKRNNIQVVYKNVEELRQKYKFNNLKEFLDIYYESCSVLINKEDFHDLAYNFIKKAASQGLKYVEPFFDPQTHLQRKIPFKTMFEGLLSGCESGLKDFDVESNLIMCFLRDRSEEEAFEVLNEAKEFKSKIIAVGLDSNEQGNPPQKFERVFKEAKSKGYRLVAHAGEEGTAKSISDALECLNIERIDHGCALIHDDDLVKKFAENKIPLTMCPLSNHKLQVTPDLSKHMLKKLLDRGVMVMINSDDPAYFGGYIGENYYEIWKALNLSFDDIVALAKNSFESTFLSDDRKKYYVNLVTEFSKNNKA